MMVELLNNKISYSFSWPRIRLDKTRLFGQYFHCPLGLSFASLQLLRLAARYYQKSSSNPPLVLLQYRPMPHLRQETRIFCKHVYHVYSFVSNASCLYFINFSVLFAPMLFFCGHAMSQIQIFFSVFNSKIYSCLLAVASFRRWNSNSHTSFTLLFSSTVSLSHRCSYQMVS